MTGLNLRFSCAAVRLCGAQLDSAHTRNANETGLIQLCGRSVVREGAQVAKTCSDLAFLPVVRLCPPTGGVPMRTPHPLEGTEGQLR